MHTRNPWRCARALVTRSHHFSAICERLGRTTFEESYLRHHRTMTLLELLARTARTWIVAFDIGPIWPRRRAT